MFVDAEGEIAETGESNNRNRGDGLDRQTVFYSASFSNVLNINIPNSGVASPYPSSISVGYAGNGGRCQRFSIWPQHAVQ
jgi:hypothetical protein